MIVIEGRSIEEAKTSLSVFSGILYERRDPAGLFPRDCRGAPDTGAKPSAASLIRRGTDTILFDCGEGAQQQMMRSRCGFRVDAIFVSHWHADHFLGIFGLVQTMSFNGRTEPLIIYGPSWVHEFVEIVKKIARFNLKFSLDSVELTEGSWVRFDGYTITGFAVSHGLPALGYVLEEDPRGQARPGTCH